SLRCPMCQHVFSMPRGEAESDMRPEISYRRPTSRRSSSQPVDKPGAETFDSQQGSKSKLWIILAIAAPLTVAGIIVTALILSGTFASEREGNGPPFQNEPNQLARRPPLEDDPNLPALDPAEAAKLEKERIVVRNLRLEEEKKWLREHRPEPLPQNEFGQLIP